MIRSLVLLFCSSSVVHGCSTVLVGKDASFDGKVMTSHSDDGEGRNDPRIMYVPPGDIPSKAPVYPDVGYPRYVGYDRGPDYFPTSNSPCCTHPIGHVHVPKEFISSSTNGRTFGYLDGNYGILNDVGLQVGGESTCSAVFASVAKGEVNGTALFSIQELNRMALQYTQTARDAIRLMGYMAETHGFYGPSENSEGSGESLMVADANEGFVFHILPDDTGTSAVWVAQRVPDNHVTVVTNMFTIRTVDLNDQHNFIGSDYMYTVAKRQRIWIPNTKLDFTKVFSNGEYAHKFYSGRRMWGLFRNIAPSQHLQPNYSQDLRLQPAYPWSMAPDKKKLTVQDIMSLHRYHYQNTTFDLSTGVGAGPFGSPDRYASGTNEEQFRKEHSNHGNWERSIALFRTTYTTIIQPDKVWLGPHAAHTTCFLPLLVGPLPPSIKTGDMLKLDKKSAFWTFRYIHTLVNIRYQDLHAKFIAPAQTHWETKAMKLNHHHPTEYHTHVEQVLEAWWNMVDELVVSFVDGYQYATGDPLGYPMNWLQEAKFQDGPPPPTNFGLITIEESSSFLNEETSNQASKKKDRNLRIHNTITV